ncbi:MAG TPA: basic amino acid ABC transporter substrate-binding protein, partial [Clostridiales bacterium]|nr:basic amino acid ABC transporter substrate-binding protein [Clostridiales bacterium]
MKKSKWMVVLVLMSAMAFSLIGCGSSTTEDTMEKIKKKGEIVLGTNAAFPPFEMRKGDEVIGVDAEIAKKIA